MSIDVVALEVNPVVWGLFCDLCSSYIGEPTQDDELIDQMYEEHCALHGIAPEN